MIWITRKTIRRWITITSQTRIITNFLNSLKNYAKEISAARTFCSLDELSYLKENNLIKGGDLNNAIVFVENGKSNNTEKIIKDFSLDTSNLSFNGNILNNKELRFKNLYNLS